MNKIVSIDVQRSTDGYAVEVGGLLEDAGKWANTVLPGSPGRVAVVSNKMVFGLYGDVVAKSFEQAGFDVFVVLIGDGERHKSFNTLRSTLGKFSEKGLTRTDAVVALGGGVVGDLAGFAASIYLRGVSFLQIPTTLLSMIDSSVGGKTGINSAFGKNLLGAFYQPKGVLIDVSTLRTLAKRELTAGFCESIKHGAIANKILLGQTAAFLAEYPPDSSTKSFGGGSATEKLVNLIHDQIAFKAKIVAGDERESPANSTSASRKILNFGHTLAHALEKVTNYRYFKHGEAVGHGVKFAAALSKKLGLLTANEVNLLNDVVHRAGTLPPITGLDPRAVFETFKFDKKFINDSLQWVLLKGIGKPVIVPNSEVPRSALMSAFKDISRR